MKITPDKINIRLDVCVAEQFGISRSLAQTLIVDGCVKINGKIEPKNYKTRLNDEIDAVLPPPIPLEAKAQNIPVEIIYEDEYLLVVNKPQGMVVHPANGNHDNTLVNALLHHCDGRLSSINGVVRPGIVHRLDKNTAGLLIVAKTDEAHKKLASQIESHSFVRRYEAVVDGNIKDDSGTLNFPIGRNEKNRKKMAVTQKNSREAITHYRIIERFFGYTHVELTLETGRTHQIRVHLAHIGHAVTGDDVYGRQKNEFGLVGQCLFAKFISFEHPITGEV
ncbi:MAG: RluA family pseudouridine synthase, partial [Clostridia bacterium]